MDDSIYGPVDLGRIGDVVIILLNGRGRATRWGGRVMWPGWGYPCDRIGSLLVRSSDWAFGWRLGSWHGEGREEGEGGMRKEGETIDAMWTTSCPLVSAIQA